MAIILTDFSDTDTDYTTDKAVFASAQFELLEEGEPCAILVYKDIFARNEGEMKQILAHEIYHCAQKFNLNLPDGELVKSQLWWIEGTADYFSGLVYHKTNFEFIAAQDYKPQTMLFLQPNTYSTSSFFQSLSNSWAGPDLVDYLAKELATEISYSNQWQILSKLPSVDLHFKKFAEDLTTRGISDPGGGNWPLISLVSSFSFEAAKTPKIYDVQLRPFSIISSTFSFPKGGIFEVKWPANDLEGDPISISTRQAESDALWEDIYPDYPKIIDTSCNAKPTRQEFLPLRPHLFYNIFVWVQVKIKIY